jgi:hypothetical protein
MRNENKHARQTLKGKKLRIFHSFEQAEAAADFDAANKTPAQRVRDTVQLILRAYGVTQEDLNRSRGSLRIKIIRYE